MRRVVASDSTKNANRRVVVLLSNSPVANDARQIYEPSDRPISRQRAARQCSVWRASLATGRRDYSATTHRKGDNDKGCVVTIDNAKRKVYQISHHKNMTYNLR
jgi:hypothetical protein